MRHSIELLDGVGLVNARAFALCGCGESPSFFTRGAEAARVSIEDDVDAKSHAAA
jgi:hypothetical protein